MRLPRSLSVALLLLVSIPAAFASAYNARPKLVVIIVIDQYRGDYLERYRDQFGDGVGKTGPGASPHNLMSDTLGDEMKLATGGKARVFAISLKDRAAVLPAGFSGDAAYWIDPKSGDWITSTYYRPDLPEWVRNFNGSHRAQKFWNREWKDSEGNILGSTAPRNGKDGAPAGFYEVVGSTPFADDYQLQFAKELVLYEKLGAGLATDLLVISLSANDLLGHEVGPDSPQMRSMALELDRRLAEFFGFLGHQVGMANVWMALSADHGIAPLPEFAKTLRLPAANLDAKALREHINSLLSRKYAKKADYLVDLDYPIAWLSEDAFAGTPAGKKESDAEADAGEAMKQSGLTGYFTKSQLARGETPATEVGRRYSHSYSPKGGWYVIGMPNPFQVGITKGTDHETPFSYDTHVPLAFYGLAFQPGTYRTHAEPIDLAVTLSSLLGINAPAQATGRVLTEALQPPHHSAAPSATLPASTPTRATQ